jgi:hypothetical protein
MAVELTLCQVQIGTCLLFAALLNTVGASPTSSKKPDVEISRQNVTHKPNQDGIIRHLQDNGHIQWKPHGKGHYVDISIELWDMAAAKTSPSKHRSRSDTSLVKRGGGGGDTGSISGMCPIRTVFHGSHSLTPFS